MNDNLPHLLNISKLTDTLTLKLPIFWVLGNIQKLHLVNLINIYFAGKKNKLVLRKSPLNIVKFSTYDRKEFK